MSFITSTTAIHTNVCEFLSKPGGYFQNSVSRLFSHFLLLFFSNYVWSCQHLALCVLLANFAVLCCCYSQECVNSIYGAVRLSVYTCACMCVHVQTTKFLLVFVCLFCLRCLSTWQWYFSCPFPACLSSCPVHIVKPHLTGSQFVAESESVFAMLFWLRFWFACSTLLHAMRNNVITISALKSPFTMHFCGYSYCNAVNSRLMVGSILMTRAFIGYFVAKIVTKLHLRWNFKMTSLLYTNEGEWNKQGSAKFSWFYVNISIIGWIK